jgi:hypothetical protein
LLLPAAPFFSPRSDVLVGEDENLVLDCYRLAHYYNCNPEIFLAMPLSQMEVHIRHTNRIAELMRDETKRDG